MISRFVSNFDNDRTCSDASDYRKVERNQCLRIDISKEIVRKSNGTRGSYWEPEDEDITGEDSNGVDVNDVDTSDADSKEWIKSIELGNAANSKQGFEGVNLSDVSNDDMNAGRDLFGQQGPEAQLGDVNRKPAPAEGSNRLPDNRKRMKRNPIKRAGGDLRRYRNTRQGMYTQIFKILNQCSKLYQN